MYRLVGVGGRFLPIDLVVTFGGFLLDLFYSVLLIDPSLLDFAFEVCLLVVPFFGISFAVINLLLQRRDLPLFYGNQPVLRQVPLQAWPDDLVVHGIGMFG